MARESRIILDDDDPPPRQPAPETARHGFECGLAATLIGSTFLIMGGNCILGPNLRDIQSTEFGLIVCGAGAELLCGVGVLFGIHGLGRARQARQPTALSITGILLCAAAMVLWLMLGMIS